MGKAPAFQLYASDFDMDTASWDNEEVGIYFRLLMYQWVNGSIPSDTQRLAKIVRMGHKKFQNRWQILKKKFIEKDLNNLINKRMEKVRAEQVKYKKEQSAHGVKGVEAKKKKGIYPFNKSSDPSSNPSSNPARVEQALHLQSSSSSLEQSEQVPFHFEFHVGDYLDDILSSCEKINQLQVKRKDKFNPYMWVQVQTNNSGHPQAILETLKAVIDYWHGIKKGEWGYANKIMATKSGNYHEADHIKQHQKFKEAFDVDPRVKELLKPIGEK